MVRRKYGKPCARGKGLRTSVTLFLKHRYAERPDKKSGRSHEERPPFRDNTSRIARYAATLIFSTATAARFDSGWATSPASLSSASLFFEVSATSASNAERT